MQELSGAAGYIFAAVMLVLLGWHFALYLRAMRARKQPAVNALPEEEPAENALAEEEPAETPARRVYGGLCPADAGLIVLAWVVCAAVRTLAAVLLAWPSPQRLSSIPAFLMFCLAGPFVMVLACYTLVRRFGGGKLAAGMCALIASVSLMWDALGAPYALLALVFLLRSMDDGHSRAANLFTAAAFLAFSVYLEPSAALFGGGLWLILMADGVIRLTRREDHALTGFLCAALFPLAAAAWFFVMQLPGAAIAGVLNGGLWPWLWLRVHAAFSPLISLPSGLMLSADCVVCMAYGTICAALSLWAFFSGRDPHAIRVCAVALISLLALLFGGFRLAPMASLLAAGCLWGRWCERGGKLQVLLGGGMLLALCVITDAISFLAVL